MTQHWYAADHDAEVFPYVSAFVSSEWEKNESEQDYGWNPPLAEVRGTRRFARFADRPQGATGGHVCGDPEWFARGVPVDPDRPPVLYTADGLPVCCRPGRGIAWGRAPAHGGGIAWGSAYAHPGGGLYWTSSPAPPPVYSDYYTSTLTFFPLNLMTRTGPGVDRWNGAIVYLLGPNQTGIPDHWEIHNGSSFVLLYHTDGWDGTGTRSFVRDNPTSPPTCSVSVWP